jgi:hypothetical protein
MKLAIPIAVIILGGICLWIGGNPSRHAQQIVPGTPFEAVLRLLGEPQLEKNADDMTLCYFRPNFASAGPIRVGFDSQRKTVYLKIWEDAPPQWDLRRNAN